MLSGGQKIRSKIRYNAHFSNKDPPQRYLKGVRVCAIIILGIQIFRLLLGNFLRNSYLYDRFWEFGVLIIVSHRNGGGAYDCPYMKIPLHFMSRRLTSPNGDADL